jgi:uncharacterized protein involved in exopolysaccharide biosynthesis
MFEPDNRDREGRARSLLSLGPESRGRHAAGPSGSTSQRDNTRETDAAARHRLARARREAAPSPLLEALADKPREKVSPVDDRPERTARGLRAVLSERLLGGRPIRDTHVPAEDRGEPGSLPHDSDMRHPEMAPPSEMFVPREHLAATQNDQIWRPLIDPMKVIGGVIDSRLLIASTTVLGAMLGVAIALSTPKKYEALTEILVDPRDLQLVERDVTGPGLPSDTALAVVENQVRVMTSGSVLNEVVDKLNLENDPEFNGRAGGGLGIGNLVADLRSLLSRRDAGPDDARRRSITINHLADALSVERGGKTFVVAVGVKTEDPEKSALIANTMADVFLQTYGKIQADTAGRATDELTSRLDELRSGVEDAERKVETFKAEHDLVDAQGKLITDDEILKLNEQLSVARARTLELNAKAASSKGVNVDSAVTGTLPEELTSNVMIELRAQYAALRQEANKLAVRLGPRHPERLAIEAQIDGERSQIAAEIRRIVSSTQTELKRAVQLEQELSARLAQLKVRQGSVSADQVTLRELEREAAAKRAVYEAFLLRAKQTGEQKDINTANISVISKAYPPLDPTGPSRSMIALTGLFLGMFAGIGMGATRGALRSLRDRTEGRQDPPSRQPPPRPGPVGPTGGSGGHGRREDDGRDGAAPSRSDSDGSDPVRPPRWRKAFRGRIGAGPQPDEREAGTPDGARASSPSQSPAVPVETPSPGPLAQQPAPYPPALMHQPTAVPGHYPMPYGAWLPPHPHFPMPVYPTVQGFPYAPVPVSSQAYPPRWVESAPIEPRYRREWSFDEMPAEAPGTIEEIRDSLRDFREALHELTEFRARRYR